MSKPAPTVIEPSSGFITFLLGQIRCAELRARIVANELKATAVALNAGLISVEAALLHLNETGAIGLTPTSSDETANNDK